MNKTLRTLLALALAAATSQAFALGLGPIVVKSRLDEPLVAEIAVTGVSPDEAAGLQARVGSSRQLEAGGLDAASGSAPIELQVVEGRDGRPVIRVTTKRAVRDPLVSFVVNVSWPSGRLVREYSVAVPSASAAQGTVAQAAPEPERAPRVEPSAAPKPPAKPVAAKPIAVEPVAKAAPRASAPVAAKPAEPKSAPPPKPVVAEAKPAPVKSAPPPAPAPARPVAADESKSVATPAKPAPPPAPTSAPAKPAAAETKPVAPPAKAEPPPPAKSVPVATAAPPPAVPASDKSTAARTELERAKAELAAKESDTSALKARVEELERSQPTNRERLEEENRKLAEAERQLNDLAREATAQQQALTQLQAQPPQIEAPPAADAGAAPSAPAGDAGGTAAPATAQSTTGTEPAAVAPLPQTDAAAGPSPPPRPERSLLDQWLVPGALALVALLGALFAFSRMRRPSTAAAAPVLADTADEAEFDLSEPESETPIALADEAAPTRATSEDEAQFEMLRLFYLRGDHAGFEDTARFVREHNPDPDLWRRVAEMGRMLAPDNPLYADASARRMEFDFSDLQPPQPAETMVEQESGLHDTMFELEPEPDVAAPPAQRADSEPEPFEFDQRPPPPPPMDDATVAMPTLAPELEQPPLEWEPSVADVEPEPQPEPEPAPAPVAADSASHAGGPQDPVDTKLELAQAYLEMGDAEGAQHMLDEVMNEGDSRQKAEALRLREQAGPAQRRA